MLTPCAAAAQHFAPGTILYKKAGVRRAARTLSQAEEAALSASDVESDDGLGLVMRMLDAEGSAMAPLPPPDVEVLLERWRTAEWGCGDGTGGDDTGGDDTGGDDTGGGTPRRERAAAWSHADDCVVADVMTGTDAGRQADEARRRLPGRPWEEVCARFAALCGGVLAAEGARKDDAEGNKGNKGNKWARRRRWGDRAGAARAAAGGRHQGVVKTIAKWR